MIRRGALLGVTLAFAMAGAATAETVASAPAGVVRVLDKITGAVTDLTIPSGETAVAGHLSISLGDCRYPVDNPSGNAYAELKIIYRDNEAPVFEGWMIAAAPALNALDHPRYDVWVLNCELG